MQTEKFGFVYILASGKNGTLYIGVTHDLQRRIWQHKHKEIEGFTSKYGVDRLVYYEIFNDIASAIEREKKLKQYKRHYKIKLIEKKNPGWNDLYETLFDHAEEWIPEKPAEAAFSG